MGIQYLEEARSASSVKWIEQDTKLHAVGLSTEFLQTSFQ